MDSLHEANSESVPKDVECGDNANSRQIRVSVDTSASAFEVVEKTNWNEGSWSDTKGTQHTLSLNGSDVSGILRFMRRANGSEDPEFFLVAFGKDNAYAWCDLKVDLGPTRTGAYYHHKYYDASTPEYSIKQDHNTTATQWFNSGTKITVTIKDDVLVVA
ncbi:hypothetical protein BDL97_18G092700 [Sphagnum fallax]|jgi:hypothetical protein|nr:hypothetical protein BDL97_18G091700 [Sphagnum fallax]KAH8934603.1 hypothetical protein BDL97_18G092300 [Sphagnum fallax]KAH8934607.1 hypothetical protein BDL97_18G092700 [Sphagnum fallax]